MKPPPPFDKRGAYNKDEDSNNWHCQSCGTVLEPYQNGPGDCANCASYWEEVSNGLWETE